MSAGQRGLSDKFHTLLFFTFGGGILLAYGLGTASFSLPKWVFVLLAAGTIACWAALRCLRARSIAFYRTDLLLVAFAGNAGLSLVWSPDPAGGFAQWVALVALVVVTIYVRHCDADALAFRFGVLCAAVAAILVLRAVLLPDMNGGFGNENYFAETLLLLLPFLVFWFRVRTRPDRWAGAMLAGAILVVLFLLNPSRIELGAFSLLVFGLTFGWLFHRGNRQMAFAFAGIAICTLIAAAWCFRDLLIAFDPVAERLEIYINALAMWRESPLLGIGMGGFDYAYPRFQQFHLTVLPALQNIALEHALAFADAVHNEPLHLLVELGIPGLALFLWIGSLAFLNGWRRFGRSPLIAAAACALLLLTAVALLNFPFRNPHTAALAAVVFGILLREQGGAMPVGKLRIPMPAGIFVAVAGGLSLVSALLAAAIIYFSYHDYAVSQAVREKSPRIAFERILRGYLRYPISFELRRQLYLTYVDFYARDRNSRNAIARHQEGIFRIALGTGPENPGLNISRIRYLLLAGLNEAARAEIERRLESLKRRVPHLPDVYVAEEVFARASGDMARAARAAAAAKDARRMIRR